MLKSKYSVVTTWVCCFSMSGESLFHMLYVVSILGKGIITWKWSIWRTWLSCWSNDLREPCLLLGEGGSLALAWIDRLSHLTDYFLLLPAWCFQSPFLQSVSNNGESLSKEANYDLLCPFRGLLLSKRPGFIYLSANISELSSEYSPINVMVLVLGFISCFI